MSDMENKQFEEQNQSIRAIPSTCALDGREKRMIFGDQLRNCNKII